MMAGLIRMAIAVPALIVCAALSSPVRADEALDLSHAAGIWRAEGKDSLVALYPCAEDGAPRAAADRLCGRVVHARKAELNGRLVLVDFQMRNEEKLKGRIIDPRSGSVYSGRLRLTAPDLLEVKGCLFIFCRTQTWVRVARLEEADLAGDPPASPVESEATP